ncbi:MAG: glycosyltransferase family 4 protein [Elsteraceae bacterium]
MARHIDGLARGLAACGADVTILAPNMDAIPSEAPYRAITGGPEALRRALAQCDLLHAHGARTPFSALAALLARMAGKPFVYTPHCYYDQGGPGKRLAKALWDQLVERWLLRASRASVLLDDSWEAYLRGRGLPTTRAVIVPNGVRAAAAPSPPETEPLRLTGAPALLSVGRLDPVKRINDLIACLSLPGLERAALHVVGVGPDRERLERQASAAGLTDRVIFHGWKNDAWVEAAMRACDLFLLASSQEGMPTVLLESLGLGAPTLASDLPGNRAIADAVDWPAIFPPGDLPALSSAILAWAGRPIPAEVPQRIAALFSWDVLAPRMMQIYGAASGA